MLWRPRKDILEQKDTVAYTWIERFRAYKKADRYLGKRSNGMVVQLADGERGYGVLRLFPSFQAAVIGVTQAG